MEVFTQYFRRLLVSNASQIFPTSARSQDGSGSYQLLVSEMQKITRDPQQANKIAESLDTTDGDLFRDFDLSTFMDHFRLDHIAKTTLAVACRTASKPDLRTKGEQNEGVHITWTALTYRHLQPTLFCRTTSKTSFAPFPHLHSQRPKTKMTSHLLLLPQS